MESYTFLYVPCNPLDILVNCYTFLYVPYTFRIRSPHKMKDFYGKLYVPIRSTQPSRDSCFVSRDSHSCPNVAILFPFLYVPLYVPIRSHTMQTHKAICGGLPAHTPIITSMIFGTDTAIYRHTLFYKLLR